MRTLLGFFLLLFPLVLCSAEPFLKAGDVVALVGGEDVVVAAEDGSMEALLQAALPDARLKFRSLAREGDTVFEQRRDLNYPALEVQLEKAGATVVIAQFGAMESRRGKAQLAEFVAAYEKLLGRLQGPTKRRIVLIEPTPGADAEDAASYAVAVQELASRSGFPFIALAPKGAPFKPEWRRADGTHLSSAGQWVMATQIAAALGGRTVEWTSREAFRSDRAALLDGVVARNVLWFHYSRPQNWAFLAGDRTNQPSSRDHIDRSKRWFPEELEQFVPLIDAKEKQIWELAAQRKP